MNRARKRSRKSRETVVWLGIGLVTALLLLITLQPGLVLGLVRPSSGGGSEAAKPTATATSSAVTATSPGTSQPTAAVGPAIASPSPAPSTGLNANPSTAPGTPATAPAITDQEPPEDPSDSDFIDNFFGDYKPSGLTPLAECCGGPPAGDPLTPQQNILAGKIVNGKQRVKITLDSDGYSPLVLVLQRGVETTLEFDMKRADSCNDQIWFPLLDKQFNLAAGEKIPAFKAQDDFAISCWMGMRGIYVRVVKDLAKANIKAIEQEVITALNDGSLSCH